MFGWSKRARETKLRAKSLDMAETWQMGVYSHFRESYKQQYGDKSVTIAAGLSNFIFRFGDLGSKIAGSPSDSALVMEALEDAYLYVQEGDIRQEISAGVILAGAAQQVPLPKFRAHLEILWKHALVDVGEMTPDVRPHMTSTDYVYHDEATRIQI